MVRLKNIVKTWNYFLEEMLGTKHKNVCRTLNSRTVEL